MLSPFQLTDYRVRVLDTSDLPSIQLLLDRCADFHLLVTGEPPKPGDASNLLEDHPPDIAPDDKIVFGIFSPRNELLGVLDLARNYPLAGIWWIGLLLLDPICRGQGLGKQVYTAFEAWARKHGANEIRLGVVERNEKALRFWESLGFQRIVRRPPVKMGQLEQAVFVLSKPSA
jgi:GNAT superfamily N-acetyltransferase